MATVITPVITPDKHEQGPTGVRICCPLCTWAPTQHDLWMCACGHEWHTFDTGGVCPACMHQWSRTQCLSCRGWSAHSSWYCYC